MTHTLPDPLTNALIGSLPHNHSTIYHLIAQTTLQNTTNTTSTPILHHLGRLTSTLHRHQPSNALQILLRKRIFIHQQRRKQNVLLLHKLRQHRQILSRERVSYSHTSLSLEYLANPTRSHNAKLEKSSELTHFHHSSLGCNRFQSLLFTDNVSKWRCSSPFFFISSSMKAFSSATC